LNIKAIIISIGLVIVTACNSNDSKPLDDGLLSTELVNNPRGADADGDLSQLGRLVFVDSVHDFGKIKEGETVQYDFEYCNVGKQAILINDATTSCGCTVPNYKKDLIAVQEKGKIEVKFNSSGKHGMQDKDIFVITNGNPSSLHLNIIAEVE
jgi:Protein of unknown function (DUF1573)